MEGEVRWLVFNFSVVSATDGLVEIFGAAFIWICVKTVNSVAFLLC